MQICKEWLLLLLQISGGEGRGGRGAVEEKGGGGIECSWIKCIVLNIESKKDKYAFGQV